MIEKKLAPDYSEEVLQEVEKMHKAACLSSAKDLRGLLFFSIDNPDSLDLDQLTYAEPQENGNFKIYVAIADVDALVPKGSPIDRHASFNTTSVYTPIKVFAMIPEKLSNNLTSLNYAEDRLSIVIEVEIGKNGETKQSSIYRACVNNKAKLNYDDVAEWISDPKKMPQKFASIKGLPEQIMLQDQIAVLMQNYRLDLGALSLEPIQSQPIVKEEEVVDLKELKANRATLIIENFMIAANGATTYFLDTQKCPTFRRVVRVPKNWPRIVEVARDLGFTLPIEPHPLPLEKFLEEQKRKDPITYPDLSLTVIKLLGRGEYVIQLPGDRPIGHFGLAVKNYSHSTAPNRRYPDLITQRLIKAALLGEKIPYTNDELLNLATHCTAKEDDAEKVERKVKKAAAAIYLSTKIGHSFKGIVTGSKGDGTWVRIFHPPVDGKLVQGYKNLQVGDRLRVKLLNVDVANGFIDFARDHS